MAKEMESRVLSLQEKMVLIRAQIPALVKRMYSEEVSYDFTKIDDIFRYLTPAMNRYKVNLEIVGEKPTYKEQENLLFVRFLDQLMVWMYEADLTLCWINAENPEDKMEVTIHAIGTHEMPEKAKGSGWTYALKYYLLDKFGIDQGGEDPDKRAGTYFEEDKGLTNEESYEDEGSPENFMEDGDVETRDAEDETAPDTRDAFLEKEEVFREQAQPEKPKHVRETAMKTKGRELVQIPPTSPYLCPENGSMVRMPEGMYGESGQEDSLEEALEEAKNIICNLGILNGKRLGELLEAGEEGIANLHWIANQYKGKNERLRQGARLILQSIDAA